MIGLRNIDMDKLKANVYGAFTILDRWAVVKINIDFDTILKFVVVN